MKTLLGLDFEATTTDPLTARVIEAGAALWDVSTHRLIGAWSWLITPANDEPDHDLEIYRITRIARGLNRMRGILPQEMLLKLELLISQAAAIVTHNGIQYDIPLLSETCKRAGTALALPLIIDTMVDVPYPAHIKTRNLTHLAAEHGFINPFPHTALGDVLTMMRILNIYPIDEVVANAASPWVRYIGKVSFDEKHLAKEAGFHWDAERKVWFLRGKERMMPAPDSLPFPIIAVPE